MEEMKTAANEEPVNTEEPKEAAKAEKKKIKNDFE